MATSGRQRLAAPIEVPLMLIELMYYHALIICETLAYVSNTAAYKLFTSFRSRGR